jgi:hypothetical protein
MAPQELDVLALVKANECFARLFRLLLFVIYILDEPKDHFLNALKAAFVEKLHLHGSKGPVSKQYLVELGENSRKLTAVLHYLTFFRN